MEKVCETFLRSFRTKIGRAGRRRSFGAHTARSHSASRMLLAAAASTVAFLYRPRTGIIWDPSCVISNGTTSCISMYVKPGTAGYSGGFLASSSDGVHFADRGVIDTEWPGVGWFKAFFYRACPPDPSAKCVWAMNHGTNGNVSGPDDPAVPLQNDRGCPAGTGQCLRHLRSHDLMNWKYMYTTHPDASWYELAQTRGARWDAAYVLNDTSSSNTGKSVGQMVAFPTATPIGAATGAGMMLAADGGLNWTVAPPPAVQFGGIRPFFIELGGVERLADGRYYMLGGSGRGAPNCSDHGTDCYAMHTFVSHTGVRGPYVADAAALRLSGTRMSMSGSPGHTVAHQHSTRSLTRSHTAALTHEHLHTVRRHDRACCTHAYLWLRAPVSHTPTGQGGWGARPSHFGQGLAAWVHDYDGGQPLVSQYLAMPHTADCGPMRSLSSGGHVWMLPLREPRIDTGHLRLHYWRGNDKMIGKTLRAPQALRLNDSSGSSGLRVALLPHSALWDHGRGVVMRGELRVGPLVWAAQGMTLRVTLRATVPAAQLHERKLV